MKMKEKELLKYIDIRLEEIIRYFNVLDEKYKINILTDIKNKVRKEIENEKE